MPQYLFVKRLTNKYQCSSFNKIRYLVNYANDESYPRGIVTQLNRAEKWHDLASVSCHSRRGEIRKRDRGCQEATLVALGLVTNAVLLWNAIYMQHALSHLKQTELSIPVNDIAGL